MAAYLIKVEVPDPTAWDMRFEAQKTMYGGTKIAVGDTIYVVDSETQGGQGLVARGVVTEATALEKPADAVRYTPRVTVSLRVTHTASKRLGRAELKRFDDWDDGRPETELNFKFYRQATNKIGGLSPEAAGFLDNYF
ncbi:MAG: hypothetical protein AAFX10_08745 [Pseudomonadota bacterium]